MAQWRLSVRWRATFWLRFIRSKPRPLMTASSRRAPLSSVSRVILFALVLLSPWGGTTRAEDETSSHIIKYDKADFDGINFRGRTAFEISDPDLLPRQLVRAIEPTGCRYMEDLKRRPFRFIQIEKRRFALVPCVAVMGWDQIYDLRDVRRPRLLQVPVLAGDRGFSVTSRPGGVSWNKDAQVFEVESRSDMCGTAGGTPHL